MLDIKKIPKNVLLVDRQASVSDIKICELALVHGVTHYSGGAVAGRLEINKKIIEKIDAELERRRAAAEG